MSDLRVFLNFITAFILFFMFMHFVADALLQSREMGSKKSSEFKWLAYHIAIIFSVIGLGLSLFFFFSDPHMLLSRAFAEGFKVSALNAVIHAVIDSVIWRGYKVYVYFKFRNVTLESPILHTSGPAEWDKVSAMSKDELIKFVATNNYKYWEDHNFYSTILFDQFLHMATIIGVVWYFYL